VSPRHGPRIESGVCNGLMEVFRQYCLGCNHRGYIHNEHNDQSPGRRDVMYARSSEGKNCGTFDRYRPT